MKAFSQNAVRTLTSDPASVGAMETDALVEEQATRPGYTDRTMEPQPRAAGEDVTSSGADPSSVPPRGIGPKAAVVSSVEQREGLLPDSASGYKVSADSARLGSRLRTVIDGGQRRILICGVRRGDGADMVATGAAVALALTGIGAMALVDCNFRHPSLHRLFGLDPSPGTLSVISGKVSAEAAVRRTNIPGLSVLPTERSDNVPDAEFLDGGRIARILELADKRSGIIFCAPPLLASPETLMLAGRVDRTLLVTAAGVGRTSDLNEAETLLGSVDARALGVILTRN